MDFLDPKRKKAHRRRLMIGYVLMALALAMTTWLLLNSSFGYWVDPKTGEVIQNGTVFVDSVPGGSNIDLDGVRQGNQTATRLTLPGGKQYTIKLSQSGYRDWIRTFSLEGRHIERITYPLLVPTKLTTKDVQLYAAAPGTPTQSPNRRWLLVPQPANSLVFDRYDLNNPSSAPSALTLPESLLTAPDKTSAVTAVEWSSDNRHLLLNRTYSGGQEFIVLDTEDIGSSVNLNKLFAIAPAKVTLRDKKPDQFYVYLSDGGVLRTANSKDSVLSAPILEGIIDYKSYGSNLILYVTKEGAMEGQANFRIRENDKASYLLKSVPDAPAYLMDLAEYDGTPYYVVGSTAGEAVFVYRDPLASLKGQTDRSLNVSQVLRLSAPRFVSFSNSSQFIAVQNGPNVTILDIDGDRQFKISLKHSIAEGEKLRWMDGHRLLFSENGQSFMIDFDGSNEQQLTAVAGTLAPYFAPDYRSMFAVAPSTGVNGRFALTQTSLVAGK